MEYGRWAAAATAALAAARLCQSGAMALASATSIVDPASIQLGCEPCRLRWLSKALLGSSCSFGAQGSGLLLPCGCRAPRVAPCRPCAPLHPCAPCTLVLTPAHLSSPWPCAKRCSVQRPALTAGKGSTARSQALAARHWGTAPEEDARGCPSKCFGTLATCAPTEGCPSL